MLARASVRAFVFIHESPARVRGPTAHARRGRPSATPDSSLPSARRSRPLTASAAVGVQTPRAPLRFPVQSMPGPRPLHPARALSADRIRPSAGPGPPSSSSACRGTPVADGCSGPDLAALRRS